MAVFYICAPKTRFSGQHFALVRQETRVWWRYSALVRQETRFSGQHFAFVYQRYQHYCARNIGISASICQFPLLYARKKPPLSPSHISGA